MPTYEYHCPECEARYDLRLPVDHEPPTCIHCECKECGGGGIVYHDAITEGGYDCPRCYALGAPTLVQVLHPPALNFIGEGWTNSIEEEE